LRPTFLATSAALLVSLAFASGCSSDRADGDRTTGTGVGIDIESMNKAIAPGDDFYGYANGTWLESVSVPDDAAYAQRRDISTELTRTRLLAIVQELAGTPQERGSDEALVRRFYLSYLDRDAIEEAGRGPLAADLDRIEAISDLAELSRELGANVRADANPLHDPDDVTDGILAIPVMPALRTGEMTPYLVQGGLGMPAAAYDDPVLRSAYRDYVGRVLSWAGVADPRARARDVIALERQIAATHRDTNAASDLAARSEIWTRGDLDRRAPGIDWTAFLKGAGLSEQNEFAAFDDKAVVGIASLVGAGDVDVWKAWLAFHTVNRVADLLPDRVAGAHFRFYGQRFGGVAVQGPPKDRAVERIGELYGDVLSRYYVERYLDPAEQQEVEQIAGNVRDAFLSRVEGADWIGDETRDAAIAKLEGLRIGIGSPDTLPRIKRPRPKGASAAELAQAAQLGQYRAQLAKLGKPVDRDEWWVSPHTFGGVNVPLQNAINITAVLLQPPYYSPSSDAAANYGAIGMIIGHEMSHVLDLTGSQIDAEGRLGSIWRGNDRSEFENRIARLFGQYSAYSVQDGAAINADAEIIGDLVGLSVSYDAYRASLGRKEPPVIEGFTGDQRFFIAFAQMWATRQREEAGSAGATDWETMPRYRVRTVRNVDAWYRAFDVQSGANLYLAPEDRVVIW